MENSEERGTAWGRWLEAAVRGVVLLVPAIAVAVPARAELVLQPLLTQLPAPVSVTHAGDSRLFISLIDGRVLVLDDGHLAAEPFLDLRGRVFGSNGLGLWSIAVHPDLDEGLVFAHYAEAVTADSIVSRFHLSASGDQAQVDSEEILLRVPKTRRLHYGGQLAFGTDGLLYVSMGESTGRQGGPDPECRAQSLDSLEGKILRLDVDDAASPPYYSIPPDNPFFAMGQPEVWALGFRNPWRFSFDRQTGDLWIADVGEDRREEVNWLTAPLVAGANFGWKVLEGSRCVTDRTGCGVLPPCDDASLVPPAIEYSHNAGHCAVIGGVVYRGRDMPALFGRYIYGDHCSGRIWAATQGANGLESVDLGLSVPRLVAFGEDVEGALYVLTLDAVYRLIDPDASAAPCQSSAEGLCLGGNRFRVTAEWRTTQGTFGLGQGVRLTDDTGTFWFFDVANVELVVKVLDACPFSGHYWVFAGGLTDVGVTLRVTDTVSGDTATYENPSGQSFSPIQDTMAFATCP